MRQSDRGATTTAYQGGTRRREVLDAAAACFWAKGYDATTIEDIAEQLGATKGRVYHHFPSKGDVFLAVCEHAMAIARLAVEPGYRSIGAPTERLERMVKAHLSSMMENLAYHQTISAGLELQWITAGLTRPQRGQMQGVLELREAYEAVFLDVLIAGVGDGSMATADPTVTVRAMLGLINSVPQWYRPRKGQSTRDREALVSPVVDLIMSGVRPHRISG